MNVGQPRMKASNIYVDRVKCWGLASNENQQLGEALQEVVVAYFKVLPRHSAGWAAKIRTGDLTNAK
jgi:hypothetical protein